MSELPKTFAPGEIEARWYAHWETSGAFRPARPNAEPFTIVIPPPNVTGSLHIGHALDNTLQDILIRHARMKGRDALWVVGTDHAGIATQMVVERQLNERQQQRTDFTREEFVAKVWEWKQESGGTITRQLRRLGASCDWANERFTMDDGFSRAVIRVFVQLYDEKLIYRDKRLVNWDPKLGTAISDLEVETREVQGKFWHLRYPLADGSRDIVVATTRPETMLADMAVAVHPEDERYKSLICHEVRLPITGRLVPIIADEHADPSLGSGAVKITPGHDFNDFEVGVRAGFKPGEMLNMFDATARVVQTADGLIPAELVGLDRFAARDAVVAALETAGLLVRVEDRAIQTPFGDRSAVVIEPWLTDQWYVDAKTLAGPAIAAVRSGATRFVPDSWSKTYFNWMETIQPWCVSRQLWWGHRIPAWYAEDGRVFVAEDEAMAQEQAGEGVALTRDPDVLDTWFSSALWPFGTLGWPEDSAALERYYPTSVLVTGFDIIFFWVARMMMQGIHFMDDVPFATVYCHGLVRDAKGQKMSKSRGNTVDPLELIDRYGADALRFTLAAMESQGRDIKLDERRVEGYRNFATKLWNAARFAQANGITASRQLEPPAATLPINLWVIAETVKAVQALDLALADYRFDEAANSIYHFTWDRFCDWYLELIKPVLQGEDAAGAGETRLVAGWVLDQILAVLHPFMPFVTEELWHAMGERPHDLIVAHWPQPDARSLDPTASADIEWLIGLISAVRSARADLGISPGLTIDYVVADPAEETVRRLDNAAAELHRLARFRAAAGHREGAAMQIVHEGETYHVPLEGVIDLAAERARLSRDRAAAEKERDALAARLANPSFVERAKPEAVEKARADHAERHNEAERLAAALARLG
jgi:valyl-tRNA synthetase